MHVRLPGALPRRGNGAHAPNEWFLIKSSNPKVNGLDEAAMAFVEYLYIVAQEAESR